MKVDDLASGRLAAEQRRLLDALRVGVDKSLALLQRTIMHKLSGSVLNVRTGTLRRSVRMEHARIEGGNITGYVAAAGGPAWYGRLHEFGVPHSWEIRPRNKKALRFVVGGEEVFAKYVNHPPLKERSFIRSSLKEVQSRMLQIIRDEMRRAI